MKKTIRKIIAGMMVCSIAGVFAINAQVDITSKNIKTGIVLATSTDASTEESTTGPGGTIGPSGGASSQESTTENPSTRPTQSTTEQNRTTEERPEEIVGAEEEIELEEARLTYPEQVLSKENGYFIYQVQAAKPYYRIFFSVSNEAGNSFTALLSDGYFDSVHGADNVLRPSASGADRLTSVSDNIHKNYTFILDVSNNINASAFDTAKEQIVEFLQGLSKGETLTLYTTSGSLSDYKLIENVGNEDVEDSIISEIQNIRQEADTAELEIVRERVLQDRFDYNQDYDNDTPPDSLRILVEITNMESAEDAQAADETTLADEIFVVDINANIEERLHELQSELDHIYVVDLRGVTNEVDEVEQDLILYLYDDDNEVKYAFEPYAIQIRKGVADNEPPVVEWIAYTQEENELWIQFSEPVFDADNVSHYQVTNKETDENINVLDARVGNNTGNVYILTLAEIEDAGEYEFSITGSIESGTITDRSAEKNGLADYTDTFTVQKYTQTEPSTKEKSKKLSWWEIVLIILVLLLTVTAVVIVMIRQKGKNKNETQNKTPQKKPSLEIASSMDEAEDAEKATGRTTTGDVITLLIQREGKAIKKTNKHVGEGLIVGRADVSDVVLDEAGMASEHFVIEYDGEDFYVQDLETLMGTSLNGIRMKHKRRLESGDRIRVGKIEVVVYF